MLVSLSLQWKSCVVPEDGQFRLNIPFLLAMSPSSVPGNFYSLTHLEDSCPPTQLSLIVLSPFILLLLDTSCSPPHPFPFPVPSPICLQCLIYVSFSRDSHALSNLSPPCYIPSLGLWIVTLYPLF